MRFNSEAYGKLYPRTEIDKNKINPEDVMTDEVKKEDETVKEDTIIEEDIDNGNSGSNESISE